MSGRRSKYLKSDVDEKAERKRRILAMGFLILLGLLVGTGAIVYNIGELYMAGKNTVQVNSPVRLMSEGSNVFIISTYDYNGRPQDDVPVDVKLRYNGTTYNLFEGETDRTGSVQPVFEVPKLDYKNDYVDLEITAGSETIKKKVSLNSPLKIIISTDKPIYQPLQVVHIRALCFADNIPLAGENSVQVEIQDPDGNKIYRESYTPNDFGIVAMDYTLSDQLPLGNYKIVVRVGNVETEKTVLVKKYVLPKFKIELEDVRSWYTVDDPISGNITCNYFFGKEVQGMVQMEVKSYLGVWETVDRIQGTLVNGKLPFSLEPIDYSVGVPNNVDNGYLELNVTVTDTGGHKETDTKIISVAREPIIITFLSDSNVRSTESNHYIIARYPDGVPVAGAAVVYDTDKYYYSKYDRYNQENPITGTRTMTDSRGVAKINFRYWNQYELSIQVYNEKYSVLEQYNIYGSGTIKAIPDKSYYEVGDVADVEVVYTGDSASTRYVYYDVLSKGFVTTTGYILLDSNDRGHFSVTITPDMAPLAEIRVYKTQTDLNTVRDIAIVGIGTEYSNLNVSITTDKQLYLPDDDIKFQFRITEDGAPVQAAIGVSVVDQSVFEVSERFSGLELVMQNLEMEFMTPQYQICNYVYSPESPAGGIPDESKSVISQKDISTTGSSPLLLSSGKNHMTYSIELENYYVGSYWFIIIMMGIIGFAALFVLALKYRRARAAVMILLFLLPIILFFAMVGWIFSLESVDDINDGTFSDTGMNRNDPWGGGMPGVIADEEDSNNFPVPTGGSAKSGEDFKPPGELPTPPSIDETDGAGYNDDGTAGGGAGVQKQVQTRQYFPETWYWNPYLISDETGFAELSLNTPDSITTWNMEAVATTKEATFGMGTKEITVFKGFFIEPDLPVSAIRNDEFPLKVLIYNYEKDAANITVTLDGASWFELLSESNTETRFVNASSVASVEFRIRANDVGTHLLTVAGDNGRKVDRVIKQMTVDPDGKAFEDLVNGALEDDQTASAVITLDPDRVPGSENAYVKLQGGIEAVTLDGAENYIHFVSGCGEQSTSKLSVDIAAYKNLLKGGLPPEKMFKFETIINQGIQHEMMYVTGGLISGEKYVVWHSKSGPADMWLTAWATFAFEDLEDAGFNIDDNIIPGFHKYLVNQQNKDGSFTIPDVGHWSMNSKLKNLKITSTAYVTRALLYSGYSSDSKAVEKAIDYISNNIEGVDDPYSIALVLLALEQADAKTSTSDELAMQLDSMKLENVDEGTVSWSWTKSSSDSYWEYDNNIETTAYAIMALNKQGSYFGTVNKAVKFLLTHRSGGCYGSTHDTAVAFQALNSISELNIDSLDVGIFANGTEIDTITFDNENKDLTYLFDLRPYLVTDTLEVKLESKGSGLIYYQVYSEQYLTWNRTGADTFKEMDLEITYDTTSIRVNDIITATVKLRYNGDKQKVTMILIDLRSPVGFSFIESEFAQLLERDIINNYELRGRQAMVYLDGVEKGEWITFSYSLLANKPIKGKIQGIHAFDMYNTGLDVELEPVMVESTF